MVMLYGKVLTLQQPTSLRAGFCNFKYGNLLNIQNKEKKMYMLFDLQFRRSYAYICVQRFLADIKKIQIKLYMTYSYLY